MKCTRQNRPELAVFGCLCARHRELAVRRCLHNYTAQEPCVRNEKGFSDAAWILDAKAGAMSRDGDSLRPGVSHLVGRGES